MEEKVGIAQKLSDALQNIDELKVLNNGINRGSATKEKRAAIKIDQFEQKIGELNDQIEDQNKKIYDLQSQIVNDKKQFEELMNQYQNSTSKVRELENEIFKYQHEVRNGRKEVSKKEISNSASLHKIRQLEFENSSLQSSLINYQKELANTKTQYEILKSKYQQINLSQNFEPTLETEKLLVAENRTLKEEWLRLDKKFESTKMQLSFSKKEQSGLQQEIIEFKQLLQEKDRQVLEWKRKYNTSLTELDSLKYRCQNLENKMSKSSTLLLELSLEKEKISSKTAILERENSQARIELQTTQKQLRINKRKNDQYKEEIIILREKIAKLEKERIKMNQKITDMATTVL